MRRIWTEEEVKDANKQEIINSQLKIVPPVYDTESQIIEVMESERRRYKRDSIVSSIIEKMMIGIAAIGFLAFLWLSISDLYITHGIAVPMSIFIAILIVLILSNRGKK